jgi:glycosyltransferase involved in cell wall biosynthesis
VRDLELTSLVPGLSIAAPRLRAMVRLHGFPLGEIALPGVDGTVTAIDMAGAIVTSLLSPAFARLAVRRLARGPLERHAVGGHEARDGSWEQTVRRADVASLISELDLDPPDALGGLPPARRGGGQHQVNGVAVRTVAVDQPLEPVVGLDGYSRVRLVMTRNGRPFAHAEAALESGTLSVPELRDAASQVWVATLLGGDGRLEARAALGHWMAGRVNPAGAPSVSVVLATLDRPDDLRICLTALAAQQYDGRLEIVVVDNAPGSGLTPPVAAGFPGVRVVAETRRGLSYARNAGLRAASGDILATTDDDVTMANDWVAQLAAPFVRPDVALVTGNILAGELDTAAQQHFETYGGLGRGYARREFDRAWLLGSWAAAPTWELGATANAAVRARVVRRPDVGMLPEWLGPGTPTGVGEDTYLFYRILLAGWTAVYEPSAFVWHRHRREERALRRQLYAYSSGHVAYLVSLWLEHRDPRGLARAAVHLPVHHLRTVTRWLRGNRGWPASLIATEIAGNLAAPWLLWRSRRRARRLAAPRDEA